jgi:diguanylate cyclase (GGDEF)-like protein
VREGLGLHGSIGMLIALTATLFLAEQYLIHVEFRSESHSYTYAGVPLALGVMMLPIPYLVAARVLASAAAFALQRIAIEKVLYNLSAYAFEAALTATAAHHLLGGSIRPDLASASVLIPIMISGDQLTSVLVLGVIRIHGGTIGRRNVWDVVAPAFALTAATSVFAVAVRLLLRDGVLGCLIVLILLTVTVLAYRGYSHTARKHRSLALVHDFVAGRVEANSLEDVGHHALEQIRVLLRAATAELVIAGSPPGASPAADSGLVRLVVGEDGPLTATTYEEEPADWVRNNALHLGEATLVARGQRDAALTRWLQRTGAADAIVAPLSVDGQHLGVVTVLDRLGDTTTFTQDDLTMLLTLTSHLAVALRSARLVEQLSYDATHDSLTGLANRARLRAQIAARSGADDAPIAVLLLDLNKFKDVNDVLGHEVGDRLLAVVSGRLAACLPTTSTIARLGGDEFAVLLTKLGPDPAARALQLAHTAAAALARPVRFEEALLAPGASVGVAVSGSVKHDDLLRCADTAMYAAKAADEPVALYDTMMDRGRAERLALVADLRVALDHHPDQFMVCYQPKVDLRTGDVISAEALVRWNHPQLGVVGPDRFVPLAETTGLIDRLTGIVLRAALAECVHWNLAGHEMSVAVNLSARNVCDPLLPARIAACLDEAALAPQHLILELTESSIVDDADRAVGVLDQLARTGVQLSLDDFGTGYSSLSYLQRLPVQEIKIDRSFVAAMSDRSVGRADALIRTIVALGHSLDLRIVAEGIETEQQLADLTELGCHVGQGYLISRPLTADQVVLWLDNHRPRQTQPIRRVHRTPLTAAKRNHLVARELRSAAGDALTSAPETGPS